MRILPLTSLHSTTSRKSKGIYSYRSTGKRSFSTIVDSDLSIGSSEGFLTGRTLVHAEPSYKYRQNCRTRRTLGLSYTLDSRTRRTLVHVGLSYTQNTMSRAPSPAAESDHRKNMTWKDYFEVRIICLRANYPLQAQPGTCGLVPSSNTLTDTTDLAGSKPWTDT